MGYDYLKGGDHLVWYSGKTIFHWLRISLFHCWGALIILKVYPLVELNTASVCFTYLPSTDFWSRKKSQFFRYFRWVESFVFFFKDCIFFKHLNTSSPCLFLTIACPVRSDRLPSICSTILSIYLSKSVAAGRRQWICL